MQFCFLLQRFPIRISGALVKNVHEDWETSRFHGVISPRRNKSFIVISSVNVFFFFISSRSSSIVSIGITVWKRYAPECLTREISKPVLGHVHRVRPRVPLKYHWLWPSLYINRRTSTSCSPANGIVVYN